MVPANDQSSTDRELLGQVSLGDERAFTKIYEQYRRKVYSYALKIIKSPELAEDVLHDVFLKIWQHRNLSAIDNLESYLRIATRNNTLKLLQRRKLEIVVNREMFEGWKDEHQEMEADILKKDTEKLLQEAISRLPPQQKTVYLLCREEGLKYNEAAERMDISPLTVKTHMQHALRFLRTYLGQRTDVVMLIILFQILS